MTQHIQLGTDLVIRYPTHKMQTQSGKVIFTVSAYSVTLIKIMFSKIFVYIYIIIVSKNLSVGKTYNKMLMIC